MMREGGRWLRSRAAGRAISLFVVLTVVPGVVLAQKAVVSGEEQAVRAQAKATGIKRLTARSSTQYLVIGDAPAAFQTQALRICGGLEDDYLAHFKAKGFEVTPPQERLTVVALSGPRAYAAFLGIKPEEAVGGEYDLETNRLVIFDNRARRDAGPKVQKANTLALVHEATHQLTFNTGLLDRAKDVPECISEGLAMYAEVRGPEGRRSKIGDVNVERLNVLMTRHPGGHAWLPMEKLLTERPLFESPETYQQAYAQSWLLVHYLLAEERADRFRTYLATLRMREDATHRIADAQAAFGNLEALDRALEAYARSLAPPHR